MEAFVTVVSDTKPISNKTTGSDISRGEGMISLYILSLPDNDLRQVEPEDMFPRQSNDPPRTYVSPARARNFVHDVHSLESQRSGVLPPPLRPKGCGEWPSPRNGETALR